MTGSFNLWLQEVIIPTEGALIQRLCWESCNTVSGQWDAPDWLYTQIHILILWNYSFMNYEHKNENVLFVRKKLQEAYFCVYMCCVLLFRNPDWSPRDVDIMTRDSGQDHVNTAGGGLAVFGISLVYFTFYLFCIRYQTVLFYLYSILYQYLQVGLTVRSCFRLNNIATFTWIFTILVPEAQPNKRAKMTQAKYPDMIDSWRLETIFGSYSYFGDNISKTSSFNWGLCRLPSLVNYVRASIHFCQKC